MKTAIILLIIFCFIAGSGILFFKKKLDIGMKVICTALLIYGGITFGLLLNYDNNTYSTKDYNITIRIEQEHINDIMTKSDTLFIFNRKKAE